MDFLKKKKRDGHWNMLHAMLVAFIDANKQKYYHLIKKQNIKHQ